MSNRTLPRAGLVEIGMTRPVQAIVQSRVIDLDRLVWDQEYRLEVARHLKQTHEKA